MTLLLVPRWTEIPDRISVVAMHTYAHSCGGIASQPTLDTAYQIEQSMSIDNAISIYLSIYIYMCVYLDREDLFNI